MKPALEELQLRLQQRFPDARLQVVDDSHLHAGHIGASGGAGHFTVHILSAAFAGLGRVARHRLVYDAVADWMPHRIHALVVKAATPAESAATPEGARTSAPTGAAADAETAAKTGAPPAASMTGPDPASNH
jgi:BolA protein